MLSTALLVLSLQSSTPALDADYRAYNCAEPVTQADMNACENVDFQRADLELNAVWRTTVAAAQAADRQIDRATDSRPTSEAALRAAQRAWLTFRDQYCTYAGMNEARGGTMEPMVVSSCRATLTRARTAQLRGDQTER